MTLLDVRQRFRKFSGRFDLVDSSGNALDTITDKFINDGQKFLDSLQRTSESTARKVELIYENDYKMPIKEVRAVKEVWVSDDESRTRLTKVSLSALRETYSDMVASSGIVGSNLISNGDFATLDGTSWTDSESSWAFGTGKAVLSTGSGDLKQAYQNMASIPIHGRQYRLTIGVTNYTTGTLDIDLGGDSQQVTTASVTSSTIRLYLICEGLKDLTISPSSDFDGELDDITLVRFEGVLTGVDTARPLYYAINIPDLGPAQGDFLGLADFDDHGAYDYQELHFGPNKRQKYRSIVFMPPADATYTMTIIGLFESTELVNDTDHSYWTENHPNLLAQAAMRELEIAYRNAEGERSATQAIQREIFNIDKDLAEEESAEINQMEG